MSAPFDPVELLRIARSLAANTNDEAALRVAVGRAYYALFLTARERLNVKSKKGESVHVKVVAAVKGENLALGERLDKLRRLRSSADYNLTSSNSGAIQWQQHWERIEPDLARMLSSIQKL